MIRENKNEIELPIYDSRNAKSENLQDLQSEFLIKENLDNGKKEPKEVIELQVYPQAQPDKKKIDVQEPKEVIKLQVYPQAQPDKKKIDVQEPKEVIKLQVYPQAQPDKKNIDVQKPKENRLKTILGDELYSTHFSTQSEDGQKEYFYVKSGKILKIDLASLYIKKGTIEEIVDLANSYIKTSNTKQEALKLYRFAAARGNRDAHYGLGNCYRLGLGVSFKEAFSSYLLAANLGHKKAQYKVGRYYLDDHLDIKINKDFSFAFHFLNLSAKQNYAPAQCELGHRYFLGEGVDKDEKEAARLYQSSAKQGDLEGQYYLALCYLKGWGLDKNQQIACRYLRSVADQGDPYAQCLLGKCYEFGMGVETDAKQALNFYQKAAQKKHPEAQYYLASCYERGFGVPKNLKQAYYYYFDLVTNYPDQVKEAQTRCWEVGKQLSTSVVNSIVRRLDDNARNNSLSVNPYKLTDSKKKSPTSTSNSRILGKK